MSGPAVDVLIPTYRRPAALAVTLAGLAAQDHPTFRVVVSDQSPDDEAVERVPEVASMARVLETHGHPVELIRHVPRRGLAEHRQSLLERASSSYVLFLDDDIYLEPTLLGRLVRSLRYAGCGFVGSAVVGLSFMGDDRPAERSVEFWDGPVLPEIVSPGSGAWVRHRLHNAANLQHLREERGGDEGRLYKVAWIGGCVMYDTAKLRAVGGFGFWRDLPEQHAGEDVVAQLRVMAQYGGAGLFPSGAYHLELPTTVPDRTVDAPHAVPSLLPRTLPYEQPASGIDDGRDIDVGDERLVMAAAIRHGVRAAHEALEAPRQERVVAGAERTPGVDQISAPEEPDRWRPDGGSEMEGARIVPDDERGIAQETGELGEGQPTR
ncbi:MAG: glycosyltransferase family 2 protein [Chloroflexota bacterium]